MPVHKTRRSDGIGIKNILHDDLVAARHIIWPRADARPRGGAELAREIYGHLQVLHYIDIKIGPEIIPAVTRFRIRAFVFRIAHWKLDGIDNGVLGGEMREFQFTLVAQGANDRLPENILNYYDKVAYTAYWHPKMYLDPIPQEEIDKRVLVQNPGY